MHVPSIEQHQQSAVARGILQSQPHVKLCTYLLQHVALCALWRAFAKAPIVSDLPIPKTKKTSKTGDINKAK